ncbi:hypothetical protein ACFQE5_06910 [Pseudonocardia hispaniensis]|uniref:Uncharacterized protein n=1 Tax=Pseudonocardia hispaniensis TaxID=904933 RepID=A0ABW1J0D1_9PSEU
MISERAPAAAAGTVGAAQTTIIRWRPEAWLTSFGVGPRSIRRGKIDGREPRTAGIAAGAAETAIMVSR